LDDFVKDLNWHAGEVLDDVTLQAHLARVRKTVGFGKTADILLIFGFFLLLCMAIRSPI